MCKKYIVRLFLLYLDIPVMSLLSRNSQLFRGTINTSNVLFILLDSTCFYPAFFPSLSPFIHSLPVISSHFAYCSRTFSLLVPAHSSVSLSLPVFLSCPAICLPPSQFPSLFLFLSLSNSPLLSLYVSHPSLSSP